MMRGRGVQRYVGHEVGGVEVRRLFSHARAHHPSRPPSPGGRFLSGGHRFAIAAFDMVRAGHASCDDFLRRNRKAVRTMLFRTIRENATACGPVVWDRAYAALAKVEPIDMAKVASLRAKAFATVAA